MGKLESRGRSTPTFAIVNRLRILLGVERHDVLWQSEEPISEILREYQAVVVFPTEAHLSNAVFI